jgi:hypothetical protein
VATPVAITAKKAVSMGYRGDRSYQSSQLGKGDPSRNDLARRGPAQASALRVVVARCVLTLNRVVLF